MTKNFAEVSKPLALRTNELLDAIILLRDYIDNARKGKRRYLIPLSSCLRSLLIEKSKKADPLLIFIAGELNVDLKLHCAPSVEDSKIADITGRPPIVEMGGLPITVVRENSAQVEVKLEEMLDRKVLQFKGNIYTPRDIIAWHANYIGGSHYSRNLPADVADLMKIGFGLGDMTSNMLLQFAEATVSLGEKLIRELTSFEYHLNFGVLETSIKNPIVVYDAIYPTTDMKINFHISTGYRAVFTVIGLNGIGIRVVSDIKIKPMRLNYLDVRMRILGRLITRLTMRIDGEIVGEVDSDQPIFALCRPEHYLFRLNREIDGEAQNGRIAIGSMLMIGKELNEFDRIVILQEFRKNQIDKKSKVGEYHGGAFGESIVGTKDMVFNPKPTLRLHSQLFS